jgi:GNAT superfamily N-acetyltransferase
MIRTATEEDIKDLASLMGELGYPTTPKEMELRFNKINSNPLYKTIVAEIDGVIVGMIGMFLGFGYEKNEDYIRIIAFVVHSKHRKKGIGGHLIQGAEEWALKKGVRKLALNSGNRSERDHAHNFYTNRGFEGSATGFYKVLDEQSEL